MSIQCVFSRLGMNESNKLILNLLIIADIIITLFCFSAISSVNTRIRPIIFIPVVYTLLSIFFKQKIKLEGPGSVVLLFILFFRYSITPLVIIVTNELNLIANNYNYITESVYVMLFEMIAIFIFMAVISLKPHIYSIEYKFISNKLTLIIALSSIFALFFTGIVQVGNFSLLNEESLEEDGEFGEGNSGIIGIIWQAFLTLLYIYTLLRIKKYDGVFAPYLSFICCLLYLVILFFGQSSISRWYTIVTLLASMAILYRYYPKSKLSLSLCIGIPSVFALILATILKNTIVGLDASYTDIISGIFNSTNMDTYFAGPVCINNAIGAMEKTGVGFNSIFYDLFNNFPLLSHEINRNLASVNVYNHFLGRYDQILPLAGQSFIWFGFLFTPILSLLSVLMVKKMDIYFIQSKGVFSYLFAFFSVWCAIMPVLNLTIWLSWIYSRIIPAAVIVGMLSKKSNRLLKY